MTGTATGPLFWGFLIVYGVIMFAISPKTVTIGGFFKGTDKNGKAARPKFHVYFPIPTMDLRQVCLQLREHGL